MLEVLDFIILFGGAFIGGIVVLIGTFMMISRRISGPNKEIQQKVDDLEREIEKLKSIKE